MEKQLLQQQEAAEISSRASSGFSHTASKTYGHTTQTLQTEHHRAFHQSHGGQKSRNHQTYQKNSSNRHEESNNRVIQYYQASQHDEIQGINDHLLLANFRKRHPVTLFSDLTPPNHSVHSGIFDKKKTNSVKIS